MRKSPSDNSSRTYSYLEVITRLEAYCAYQDRSEKEVRQKLVVFQLSGQDEDRVIAHLREHRFLDDERFVESFVKGKFRIKKWGRIKIKSELRLKGISGSLIEKYLKELEEDDEYLQTVRMLIQKKYVQFSIEKDAFTKKVKVIRYLASKGFELDLIQDVYDQFLLENN